jgi:hypothetical protein
VARVPQQLLAGRVPHRRDGSRAPRRLRRRQLLIDREPDPKASPPSQSRHQTCHHRRRSRISRRPRRPIPKVTSATTTASPTSIRPPNRLERRHRVPLPEVAVARYLRVLGDMGRTRGGSNGGQGRKLELGYLAKNVYSRHGWHRNGDGVGRGRHTGADDPRQRRADALSALALRLVLERHDGDDALSRACRPTTSRLVEAGIQKPFPVAKARQRYLATSPGIAEIPQVHSEEQVNLRF